MQSGGGKARSACGPFMQATQAPAAQPLSSLVDSLCADRSARAPAAAAAIAVGRAVAAAWSGRPGGGRGQIFLTLAGGLQLLPCLLVPSLELRCCGGLRSRLPRMFDSQLVNILFLEKIWVVLSIQVFNIT